MRTQDDIKRELADARRDLAIHDTYAKRDSFTLYEAAMLAYGKDPGFFDDVKKGLAAFTGGRTAGDVTSLFYEMLDAVKDRTLPAERVWTKGKEIDAARTTVARDDFETFRAQYGRGTQSIPGKSALAAEQETEGESLPREAAQVESAPSSDSSTASARPTHRSSSRTGPLDTVIEKAKSNAASNDYHSVWAELVRLAQSDKRPPPLLGYVEDEGVKWQDGDKTSFLTKDAFRKRIVPNARGQKRKPVIAR